MSKRSIRLSSPNMTSASARASSVLPTPVGPRKRKLPTGRFGSPRPGPEPRIASPAPAPRPGAPVPPRARVARLFWADDPLVQLLLESEQPLALLGCQLRDRDAGRAGRGLGECPGGHLRAALPPRAALVELALAVVDLVPQRAGTVVVLCRGGL